MFLAKKIPLGMKLFLLTLLCSIGMLQAASSYAQNARISLHVEEETVADVLVQIEEQSDFDFFYNNTHVDLNRRVSVSADNSDIFAILDEGYSAKFCGAAERLYKNLAKKGMLASSGNLKALAAAIFTVSGIRESDVPADNVCSFFDADKAAYDEIMEAML